MNFSQYFNKWLYDNDGYYANYKQIGKEGDFYTSVSTSAFFGGTIGKKIVDTIKKGELPKDTTIVEIGAHHGYLLADIIQFIYTLEPELIKTLNFAIVERFESLQNQQQKYIKESFGDAINLKHFDDISTLKLDNAFVIANEIFDAFGCELIMTKNDQLQIAKVDNHKISFKNCEDQNIINYCKKYSIKKGEIAVGYEDFINNLCKNINNFYFLTFDYGDRVARNDFSIRVYSNHKVFPIFDEEIELEKIYQKSDITYDVLFPHIIDVFKDNNIENITFKTQMEALVEFGIIELLEILKKNVDESTYLRETQKVKTLLEPTGMGDRFKMLLVKK